MNFPQHHHQDAHYRPGKTCDVEVPFPGEEDGEHHGETDDHPNVGNTEYEHFARNRPKNTFLIG